MIESCRFESYLFLNPILLLFNVYESELSAGQNDKEHLLKNASFYGDKISFKYYTENLKPLEFIKLLLHEIKIADISVVEYKK